MTDPGWLDRREFPFESRFHETAVGRMHYVDEGRGDPIVFVHGVPTWSFLFRKLIAGLSDGHRCVAMDHLGFGLSDKPGSYSYEPQLLADNVEGLLGSLDLEPCTLVVHDWGGPLGLPYAIRHPDRVRRIVLFNTWLWSAAGLRTRVLASLLAGPLFAWAEQRHNASTRLFIPQVMGGRARLTPAIHRQYLEPLAAEGDRKAVLALARAIRDAGPWLDVLWQQISVISGLPALIAWGMRDPVFTAADLARWRGVFDRCEVHRYETVGHFPPEEAGEELCTTIEAFISGGGGTPR